MAEGFSVWMGTGVFIINDHVYTDNSRKRMSFASSCFSYLQQDSFHYGPDFAGGLPQ